MPRGTDSAQPGNVAESIEHVLAANIEFVAHVDDALLIAFRAARPPFCANEHGFEVLWLCIESMALAIASGAAR